MSPGYLEREKLTAGESWRLLSSVVPSVKGPDSTFFRLSFTSTRRSSTSTLRCSASRHASSFCFRQASSWTCCLGSEHTRRLAVKTFTENLTTETSDGNKALSCTLASAQLLLCFPLFLLQVGQAAPHLLPLLLQPIALIYVAQQVCLGAVLAQFDLNGTGTPWE